MGSGVNAQILRDAIHPRGIICDVGRCRQASALWTREDLTHLAAYAVYVSNFRTFGIFSTLHSALSISVVNHATSPGLKNMEG